MKINRLYPVLIAMLIASLVLSACGATEVSTPAVPTAAPTTEPTAVPPAIEAAGEADMADDDEGALTGAFPENLAAQLDAFPQSTGETRHGIAF